MNVPSRILDYTIRVLKELISIPTVNPPGTGYEECSKYLVERLEELGFKVDLIEIPESYLDRYYPYSPQHKGYPRYIVYGRLASGKPALHFNGHYDVVPPGSGWSREPFNPILEGGRIFGRGATDMKGGIACILGAIKRVVEEGCEFKGCLEVAFVPDEEAGGVGTRYLVEELGCKPEYVVIGEPTTSKRIVVGHKGLIRGVVRVFGRQVHGSVPWLGDNAFLKAARLAMRFYEDYQKVLKSRKTKAPVRGEEYSHPTINLGGYAESTSKKDNIVPGEFIFSFDRRLIPEEDVDSTVEELKNEIYKHARDLDVKVDVEVKSAIPPSLTPLDSKIVKVAVEAVEKLYSTKPVLEITTGRNDAVYYVKTGKCQVINLGPGVEWTAHTPDEYTEVSELRDTIALYTYIIRKMLT